MFFGLKKFALPLILVAAGSTAGMGFGLVNHYSKNKNPFAEYIEKVSEEGSSGKNNYSLFCQEWIVNDEKKDQKNDMLGEKCKKIFNGLTGNNTQNQPEKWLQVSYSKFDHVFREYFRSPSKRNESSPIDEKNQDKWDHEELSCTIKREYEKITISCFKKQTI